MLNASYTMTFPGPIMQCHEANVTNVTSMAESNYTEYIQRFSNSDSSPTEPELETGQIRNELNKSFITSRLWPEPDGIFLDHTQRNDSWLIVVPCPQPYISDTGPKFRYKLAKDFDFVWTLRSQQCLAAATNYTVKVEITNGIQHVEYTTGEVHPLPRISQIDWEANRTDTTFGPLLSWKEYFNIVALADSIAANFHYVDSAITTFHFYQKNIGSTQSRRLENGTIVRGCNASWISDGDESGESCLPSTWAVTNDRLYGHSGTCMTIQYAD